MAEATTVADLRDTLTNLEVPDRGIAEPLSPPDLFSRKLARFDENLYNVHSTSHLYRFLLALCGEGGAGSVRKEVLYSKLQGAIYSTHFHDLDRLYGDPLALPRLSGEVYAYDPSNEPLTQNQWIEVYAKDANYRNRCLLWMRAIIYGGSPMGIALAAEAACGIECDIFAVADYLEDQRSSHPIGLTNLGRTNSDGEVVIVPRINSLGQADQRRIIALVDRIRPVDTLVTISLGTTARTQKFVSSSVATSEYSQVTRMVTGRTDVNWPDIGGIASTNLIANGSFENNTTGWFSTTSFFVTAGATLGQILPYWPATNSRAVFGTHCLMIQTPGGTTNQGARYPGLVVQAGQTYTFSCFMRLFPGYSDTTVKLSVGNNSTFGGQNSANTSVTVTQGSWIRYSVTYTAAVTGVAEVAITIPGSTAINMCVDGVQFENQLAATPYIDTNGTVRSRSYTPSNGSWIQKGIENEAPSFAWFNRQEMASNIDVTAITSSSEHYGEFNPIQKGLFRHLNLSLDDQFFLFADDFSRASGTTPTVSIPWLRNDSVVVNNYYPLDYFSLVEVGGIDNAPQLRFWASAEKLVGNNSLLDINDPSWVVTGATSTNTSIPTQSRKTLTGNNLGSAPQILSQLTSIPDSTVPYDYSVTFKGDAGKNYAFTIIQYATSDGTGFAINLDVLFVGTGDWQTVSGTINLNVGIKSIKVAIASSLMGDASPFTIAEPSWGITTSEFLEYDFGSSKAFNYVEFEIAQKPIDILVETSPDNAVWTAVSPTDNTDYIYEVAFVVSDQPWRFWRLYFDKVTARYLRITFKRRSDPFPFDDSDPFPWSVDVRNLRTYLLIQDASDFDPSVGTDLFGNSYRNVLQQVWPSTNAWDGFTNTFWLSQPNPTPDAVEALYFDVSTSLHGVTMTELDAGIAGTGDPTMTHYDALSMANMEAYVSGVGTQTINEIYIDPVFSGSDMHFYYTNDTTPDWESKLWIPVPIHYKCTHGYHTLPYSVTARYFKIEFSNLTPIPYNTVDTVTLLPTLYRKFPSWVQNYFAALTPSAQQNQIQDTQTVTIDPYTVFHIQQDKLATTRDQLLLNTVETAADTTTNEIGQIVDEINTSGDGTTQIVQETQIRFFPPTVWQDDLKNVLDLSRAASRMLFFDFDIDTGDVYMVEDTPEILDAPNEQSVQDLSAELQAKQSPTLWFPRVCRHGYQVVTGPFLGKVAYQVAIREITFWYRQFLTPSQSTFKSEYGDSMYGNIAYGQTRT
jgi:hypothetical protein